MEDQFIWTDGVETALIDLKNKSLTKSEYHKKNYYFFKGYLKYFRIPTIILSGINSVFNVGLQPYISQSIISVLCCSISLICGIIASVELFLGLQNMMEKELLSSKEFYILSSEICKILSVEREYRMLNGKIYLDNTHTKYCNLIERGNLLDKEEDETKNIKMIVNKNIKENIKENIKKKFKENIENIEANIKKNFKDNIENIEANIRGKIKDNNEENIRVKIKDNNEENIENIKHNIEANIYI